MVLKIRKSWIQDFKQMAFRSWNEEDMVDWSKVTQRAWQHNDVEFNSKLGLPPISFLRQATYGF